MKSQFIFNGKIVDSIIGSEINAENFSFGVSSVENEISPDLLSDIIDKAIRVTERNSSQVKLEDLHNDDFAHWLRDKGYYVTDQTRSGRSKFAVGEVDIMIRDKNGTPSSIIEAFRLQNCTDRNQVIDTHINKLLKNYDTAGLAENYVLVYAENENFQKLWKDYFSYIEKINEKANFTSDHKLKALSDISELYSKVTDIRVAKAIHTRNSIDITIIHIFINMFK